MLHHLKFSISFLTPRILTQLAFVLNFYTLRKVPVFLWLVTPRVVILLINTSTWIEAGAVGLHKSFADNLLSSSYPIVYVLLESLALKISATREEANKD